MVKEKAYPKQRKLGEGEGEGNCFNSHSIDTRTIKQ